METKVCNNCKEIFISDDTSCPFCGSSDISQIDNNDVPNHDIVQTKNGGSIFIGLLLGLFLGGIGFFISCCTIKGRSGSEKWKTFIGASIGWLFQGIIPATIYLVLKYTHSIPT